MEGSKSCKKGLFLSLSSGILASFAGTLGKFAMTETEAFWHCQSVLLNYLNYSNDESTAFCQTSLIYMRGVAFVLMLLLNALMMTTFVKALRYSQTSLEATVTNTAANFFASAIIGRFLFNESMGLLWWLGTVLIIFGLALMNFSSKGGKVSDLLRNHKNLKRKTH